jgi:GTP-binding protein
VANKLDLPHAREALPAFLEVMEKRRIRVLELSGATGEGLDALLDACAQVLFSAASLKSRSKAAEAPRDVVTAATAARAPRTEKVKPATRPVQKPAKKPVQKAAKKPAQKAAKKSVKKPAKAAHGKRAGRRS